MSNFNENFNVPTDGQWHAIAVIGGVTIKWFELTVEGGSGRIGVCPKRIPPNAGQPLTSGERYSLPPRASGWIYLRADGDTPLSGSMSGSGRVV